MSCIKELRKEDICIWCCMKNI